MRRWLLLASVLVLAAAGCGGGSSDGGGGNGQIGSSAKGGSGQSQGISGSGGHAGRTTSSPAARRAFIRDADRICGRAHTELGRFGRELKDLANAARKRRVSPAEYLKRAADLTEESVRTARSALSSIRALPHPADPDLTSYLSLSQTQTNLLGAEVVALRRRNPRAIARLNARLVRVGSRSRAAARRLGLHVCGGA